MLRRWVTSNMGAASIFNDTVALRPIYFANVYSVSKSENNWFQGLFRSYIKQYITSEITIFYSRWC